jgi:hypothetical protein
MTSAENRHYGCRITDDLVFKGLRTIILENEFLRVRVLLDKGADIFQFLDKKTDTDFLWRSPNGIVNPTRYRETIAHSSGSFLDFYHGGWQEIFPGGGPVNYRGADLGLHGEVTHLSWEYDILTDREDEIAVRFSVKCLRTPFKLERTLRLVKNQPVLHIDETVTNLSPEDQDFMWGHHPAFGAPFLRPGLRVHIPAGKASAHSPKFASSGILEPGKEFVWPKADVDGRVVDLSVVPSNEDGFCELIYLKDLAAGWYAVMDEENEIGFGLSWPLDVFPNLWFWLVYGKAPGYPWWDRVTCIALEPWTSIPNNLDEAIKQGTQHTLKGGGSLSVSLTAVAIHGKRNIQKINLDGSIL